MTIKAIETRYAGCHFRSRLEARWAVFFDCLGIAWEYEPQGFEFEGFRYLPDFHLPATDIYVEVKGSTADLQREVPKLATFAESARATLIVLGQIPDAPAGSVPLHSRLHRRFEIVLHSWVFVAYDSGSASGWRFVLFDHGPGKWTTKPQYLTGVSMVREVAEAYQAARSARFEHGESPVLTGHPGGV